MLSDEFELVSVRPVTLPLELFERPAPDALTHTDHEEYENQTRTLWLSIRDHRGAGHFHRDTEKRTHIHTARQMTSGDAVR